MTKEPLVSVIVPVYKAEKYLEKCVESIINQTYKNLEIILVDDGSPDNCPAMCDEFTKRDSRIKVFHKKNGGQASARNLAINNSNGDYICFVDSDDFIKNNYVKRMLDAIINSNSDLCCSGFTFTNEDNTKTYDSCPNVKNDTIIKKDIVTYYYTKYYASFLQVTNKLYKFSLFKNIRFAEGYIYEDLEINLHLIHQCKKMIIINDALYVAIEHDGSTTNSAYSNRKVDCQIFVLNSHIKFLKENHLQKYIKFELTKRLNALCWTYRNIEDSEPKIYLKQEILKHWKKYKKYLNLLFIPSYKTLLNIIYMKIK